MTPGPTAPPGRSRVPSGEPQDRYGPSSDVAVAVCRRETERRHRTLMSEVDPLFARPLFPVANEDDATRTLAATLPYVRAAAGRATILHVIEKAGGAPDKAPLEAREEDAEELFDRAREVAADADVDVETELRYGTDVAETIVEAAHDTDATAIVFSPRGGRSWWDLFSGDVREALTTESDVPVVVFPEWEATPEGDGDDGSTTDGSQDDADAHSGGDDA